MPNLESSVNFALNLISINLWNKFKLNYAYLLTPHMGNWILINFLLGYTRQVFFSLSLSFNLFYFCFCWNKLKSAGDSRISVWSLFFFFVFLFICDAPLHSNDTLSLSYPLSHTPLQSCSPLSIHSTRWVDVEKQQIEEIIVNPVGILNQMLAGFKGWARVVERQGN